jgi:hypothetical protein
MLIVGAFTALVACGETPAPTLTPATPGISADGQRFDPATVKSEIPSGAWMCDMGTVHYAAGEPKDGKCPVCGMKLVQKP